MCMGACAWVHTLALRCLQKPEEGIETSADITGDCELPNVGAGH